MSTAGHPPCPCAEAAPLCLRSSASSHVWQAAAQD
jgi:hypothetical protein